MKRSLSKRVWFYKPEAIIEIRDGKWINPNWWRLWFMGNDEFHWETVCIGFPWTGQVVFATREFPIDECDEDCFEFAHIERYPGWPMDLYDWEEKTDEERSRYPLRLQGLGNQH